MPHASVRRVKAKCTTLDGKERCKNMTAAEVYKKSMQGAAKIQERARSAGMTAQAWISQNQTECDEIALFVWNSTSVIKNPLIMEPFAFRYPNGDVVCQVCHGDKNTAHEQQSAELIKTTHGLTCDMHYTAAEKAAQNYCHFHNVMQSRKIPRAHQTTGKRAAARDA